MIKLTEIAVHEKEGECVRYFNPNHITSFRLNFEGTATLIYNYNIRDWKERVAVKETPEEILALIKKSRSVVLEEEPMW